MSEKEKILSYIAGIVDGEGSIGFVKFKRQVPRGFIVRPRVTIVNTNKKIIPIFTNNFHDYQITIYSTHSVNHQKPVYRLSFQRGEDIERFLNLIVPYLILKREQALKILQFLTLRKEHTTEIIRNPVNGRAVGTKIKDYTDEEMLLYLDVCKLNKRGLEQ